MPVYRGIVSRRAQLVALPLVAAAAVAVTWAAVPGSSSDRGPRTSRPPPSTSAGSAPLTPKESFALAVQQQWARDAGLPAPPKLSDPAALVPTPTPCVATTLPVDASGIIVAHQGGPFGSGSHFTAGSSWSGRTAPGSPVYAVWAGVTGEAAADPGLPAVDVYKEELGPGDCGVAMVPVGTFTLRSAGGPLTISAVTGARITLTATDGSVHIFDLTSDSFGAS